jgi:hypothetical protein
MLKICKYILSYIMLKMENIQQFIYFHLLVQVWIAYKIGKKYILKKIT